MDTNAISRPLLAPTFGAAISRRSVLRGLGGLGALALAAASHRTVAQEASPAAVPPLLADWAAAWSTNDIGRLTAIYAEDAVLEDVPTGVTYQGRDQIIAHVAETKAGFPDSAFTVSAGFVADNAAAAEYQFSATYTGILSGLPAGAGQAVSLPGATIIELADGQIQREAHYYDAYAFLIQLEVLPAPAAPDATPTS